jgi:hypothetical protein
MSVDVSLWVVVVLVDSSVTYLEGDIGLLFVRARK